GTSGGASVAELIGRTLLTGQALRPCTALLGKPLSRRAARTLLAELFGLATWAGAAWTSATLPSLVSTPLPRGALLSGATLLDLWIAAGALLAELLGLALLTLTTRSTLSTSALLSLLELRIAAGALFAELLGLARLPLSPLLSSRARSRTTLSTLLSLLELRATTWTLRAAWALPAELFRLALLPTWLAALLSSLPSWTSRSRSL